MYGPLTRAEELVRSTFCASETHRFNIVKTAVAFFTMQRKKRRFWYCAHAKKDIPVENNTKTQSSMSPCGSASTENIHETRVQCKNRSKYTIASFFNIGNLYPFFSLSTYIYSRQQCTKHVRNIVPLHAVEGVTVRRQFPQRRYIGRRRHGLIKKQHYTGRRCHSKGKVAIGRRVVGIVYLEEALGCFGLHQLVPIVLQKLLPFLATPFSLQHQYRRLVGLCNGFGIQDGLAATVARTVFAVVGGSKQLLAGGAGQDGGIETIGAARFHPISGHHDCAEAVCNY